MSPEIELFPADFLWGAATSAYQIEGSPLADGAGPSIWYRFTRYPGLAEEGPVGDVACDHYRMWRDDVDLLGELGVSAYRFSIAWGRVFPEGRGAVNERGLDFYRRLVDALLARGIRPVPTLYHWDLPAALDDRGGWVNPESPRWFADYARACFRALGDRVAMWTTLNEPWVSVDGGYLFGVHAPGHRSLFEAPRAAHHLLLAHARAVQAFRAEGRGTIGIVVNLEPKTPASDRPEDVAAAHRMDAYMNRQYLDPIVGRGYPSELAAIYRDGWPDFPDDEIRAIAEPIDFLGVNYYTRAVVRADAAEPIFGATTVRQPGLHTETNWEVHPESFTGVLRWAAERAGSLPIYVTENGAAFPDPASPAEGGVDDPLRVAYLRDHLRAALAARRAGVDLRGYFVWSLLDNVEWSHGRTKRFGVVHVDFSDQRRTMKTSGRFYRDVIRSRGAVLAE